MQFWPLCRYCNISVAMSNLKLWIIHILYKLIFYITYIVITLYFLSTYAYFWINHGLTVCRQTRLYSKMYSINSSAWSVYRVCPILLSMVSVICIIRLYYLRNAVDFRIRWSVNNWRIMWSVNNVCLLLVIIYFSSFT